MNKKIQALLAKNRELAAKAEVLAKEEGDNVEALNNIADEIEANLRTIEALKRAAAVSQANAQAANDAASGGQLENGDDDEGDGNADDGGDGTGDGEGAAPAQAKRKGRSWAKTVKRFAAAARRGFVMAQGDPDYNREGSDADGGYTVPEDIVTRVEALKQSKASLRNLVSVEKVKAPSGRRTFKKRSQQTGFTKVGEGGKIPRKSGPLFSVITYAIEKFAGWLPVTRELLKDSDENIVNTIVEWLAEEGRVTDNAQILAAIATKKAKDLTDLDGIRRAVLLDLDAAFRSTTKIVTNSNGVYYLSTLKDGNGRDLLTPIPSEPGKMQLACGPIVVQVEEIPNADLPNDDDKIPFIIGDLKEGIKLFDLEELTIDSSSVAMAGEINAWEQDMTMFRAIERLDVKVRDEAAFINGYITAADLLALTSATPVKTATKAAKA